MSDKRVPKPSAVRAEACSFSFPPPASGGLRGVQAAGLKGVGMMMSQPMAKALLHNKIITPVASDGYRCVRQPAAEG